MNFFDSSEPFNRTVDVGVTGQITKSDKWKKHILWDGHKLSTIYNTSKDHEYYEVEPDGQE